MNAEIEKKNKKDQEQYEKEKVLAGQVEMELNYWIMIAHARPNLCRFADKEETR